MGTRDGGSRRSGSAAGLYLAGGTGLALQLGHPRSVDLDLFTQNEFSGAELRGQLANLAGLKIRQVMRGTVHLEIHEILAARQYGLQQILTWFDQKYAGAPYNRVHPLKALTYFMDAEGEPMPDMPAVLDWSAVKSFFLNEAPRLL